MTKIILTKEQEQMLINSLTTDEALEIYTEDLRKIGWFANKVYPAKNRTNTETRNFRRIFFKFSQPFNKKIKTK